MATDLRRTVIRAGAAEQAAIDEGLRAYMLRVYNYMTAGLAITGVVAWLLAQNAVVFGPAGEIVAFTALGEALFLSPLKWLVMLAPLAFVMIISFGINRLSAAAAQALFWAFAAAMGISLASIFIAFTGASVARVFFITAATFAALSLYGYTTKRDISGWGSFLFAGLIGIIIAMVVNIFLASSALQFAISVIGVVVFMGLTAYDTQQIKSMYVENEARDVTTKKAVHGALRLYLDFINIFIMLMQLLGDRR